MEPIGIFILAMVCQLYSCAQNVSDSVEQMSYASVAGEEYLEGDKIETNLNNKVFFDFDKSIIKYAIFLFLIVLRISRFNSIELKFLGLILYIFSSIEMALISWFVFFLSIANSYKITSLFGKYFKALL